MKKSSLILGMLLFILSLNAQNKNERVVTETPRNGHSIAKINGYYCVDSETKPFTGKYVVRGYDNELRKEAHYKNGKLNGVYLEYTKRDTVYVKVRANYLNNKKVGKYIEYWRPNHKKKECSYNQNGELNGLWISYAGFAVEEPEVLGKYVNGKRDSTWTWYYEGSIPKSVDNYKLGKEHGISTEYYKNGQKKSECTYQNDYKNGKEQWWYENGTLRYSAVYMNGKLNGTVFNYYKNGKIEKEGNYLNGNKKGKFIWYNKDETVKEETTF